jgi:hypothetical protein
MRYVRAQQRTQQLLIETRVMGRAPIKLQCAA